MQLTQAMKCGNFRFDFGSFTDTYIGVNLNGMKLKLEIFSL